MFMKKIKLTQNKVTLVDNEDFEWLNQWKWYFCNGYAMRNKADRSGLIRMHRLINKTPEGLFTDHINRNKLDNRRNNLRTVNKSLNGHNTGARVNSKSGVKGVMWDKRRNKWRAEIMVNRIRKFIGYFDDLNKASMARRQYEL